jgi:NAD+ dependent glucose-6-phosphate dehydrogenase
MSVICLRLGRPVVEPEAVSLPGWLSPVDLRQLVRCALTAPVRYGVYFGTSANTRLTLDLGSARRDLGYAPVSDSEVFAGRFGDDPPPPAIHPPAG